MKSARLFRIYILLLFLLASGIVKGEYPASAQEPKPELKESYNVTGVLKDIDAGRKCFVIIYENRLILFHTTKALCDSIADMIDNEVSVTYYLVNNPDTGATNHERVILYANMVVRK